MKSNKRKSRFFVGDGRRSHSSYGSTYRRTSTFAFVSLPSSTGTGIDHVRLSRLVFSESPVRDPGRPPTLGEHTTAVLRELGYDEARIADLRQRRVIGGPPA